MGGCPAPSRTPIYAQTYDILLFPGCFALPSREPDNNSLNIGCIGTPLSLSGSIPTKNGPQDAWWPCSFLVTTPDGPKTQVSTCRDPDLGIVEIPTLSVNSCPLCEGLALSLLLPILAAEGSDSEHV